MIQRWDIYRAYINFEDIENQGKKRPILIINVSGSQLISCKITSKYRDDELEYKIRDWSGAGLDKPSYVRLRHKIYLPPDVEMVYLGTLQKQDIDNIKNLCQKYNIKLNEKLIQSSSDKAFQHNIKTEIKAGKPFKQAVAIAYNIQKNNLKEDIDNMSIENLKEYMEKVEEEPPYTKDQLFSELETFTDSFSVEESAAKFGYEKEKDLAIEILSEQGYKCRDTKIRDWYIVEFYKYLDEGYSKNGHSWEERNGMIYIYNEGEKVAEFPDRESAEEAGWDLDILNESNSKDDDVIKLYYDDLDITVQGPKRAADDWDEKERTVNWTYKIDKDYIIDFLYNEVVSEEDIPNINELTDDEIYKWTEEHFDQLFDKYQDKIYDYYEDLAREEAEDSDIFSYDDDDYDYDEHDYYYRSKYDESYKKENNINNKIDIDKLVSEIISRMKENLEFSNDKDTDIEFEIPRMNMRDHKKFWDSLNQQCSDNHIDYEIEETQDYTDVKYYYGKLVRKYPDDYYFDYESDETTYVTKPGVKTGKYRKTNENMNNKSLKEENYVKLSLRDYMIKHPHDDEDEEIESACQWLDNNYPTKDDIEFLKEKGWYDIIKDERDDLEPLNEEATVKLGGTNQVDDLDVLIKMAKDIGLNTVAELQYLIKREGQPGESPYNTLLRYRASLGNDYKGYDRNQRESLIRESWNLGSNKLVDPDSEEYHNLESLADKLNETSPNNYKYKVEETYEDYGSGMKWYNIICYDRKGNSWQVLNPKEWIDLANEKDIDKAYQSVINGEYFQDKPKPIHEMNMGEMFEFIKD